MKYAFSLSLCCFEKSRDAFVKVILSNFIVVHDWINILIKIVEPQVVPCKMLGGNPHAFKTHKIDPHN
jgi:hypothetical protein